MKPAFIALVLFLVLIASQLIVPLNLIIDRDEILSQGREYRIHTNNLSDLSGISSSGILTEITILPESLETIVNTGDVVFVSLSEGVNGSACCFNYSFERPDESVYLRGIVVKRGDTGKTIIDFPFLKELAGSLKQLNSGSALPVSGAEFTLVVHKGNAVVRDVRRAGLQSADI